MSQKASPEPAQAYDIPTVKSGLQKLFDNSTGDKSNAVDYVLIHGFNGSSEKAWLHEKPKPEFFWPKQLEVDLEESRVFLYGYDSALRFSLQKNSISIGSIAEGLYTALIDERADTNKRPIVFVAHSLGGLVLKRAISDMHQSIHSRETLTSSARLAQELYESISGLIFFGTPHLGSHINKQSRVQIFKGSLGSFATIPKNLTKALESESLELGDLSKSFERTKLYTDGKIRIRSCYETRARAIYGAEVTTRASANLHYVNEDMVPIERTHEGMVKFTSPEDHYYKSTLAFMRSCGHEGLERKSGQANSQEKGSDKRLLSSLPRYSNPIFSGREGEMINIDKVFQNSKPCHQRAVLFGLGGIGKSQIAHEYARRQLEKRSIFWVQANTAENIKLGYLAIARLLNLDVQHATSADYLTAVKEHLENANTLPWLLVLDGADDQETFSGNPDGINLAEYIPTANHGRVLITTRDSRVAGLDNGQVVLARNGIRIGPMDPEDSYCLFKECMRVDQLLDASEDRCLSFLNMLGGLPLAIVQGAAYMREEEISIEEFIADYKNIEHHEELFRKSAKSTDKEEKSVLLTWELSYTRIAGPLYPESKSPEAMLLDVLAFLDAQQSPFRDLNEIENRMKDCAEPIIEPLDLRVLKDHFQPQQGPSSLLENIYNRRFKTDKTIRSAIGRLCNYSLIGSRECWVHPVVHSWIYRRLLRHPDEICKYIKWITGELINHVPFMSPDGWEKYVIPADLFTVLAQRDLGILRHADIVLKHALSPSVQASMKSDHIMSSEIGDLLYRFGVISVYSGKVSEGVEYIQQSILATERSDHSETSLNDRKLSLAQARSRLYPGKQAVAEARLCHEETSSLEAEYWVAECLRDNGQLQDALKVLKNIINTHPITHPQQFEEKKVRFMATVNAVAILVDLEDDESKTQARQLIDKWILPFLEKTRIGHVLNTIIYPRILICRIEANSDQKDLKAACKAVLDFETRLGMSASPIEWLPHLEILEQKEKLQEIVTLTKTFTRRRPPIPDYMAVKEFHPEQSEYIDEQIIGWCEMYNSLGAAYLALGKFHKAEAAHRNAIGLHLNLHSEGSESHLFQTNLANLLNALRYQGDTKIRELEKIRTSETLAYEFLTDIASNQATSDHDRQRGNKLILHWENEEAEKFSTPQGVAFMNTT